MSLGLRAAGWASVIGLTVGVGLLAPSVVRADEVLTPPAASEGLPVRPSKPLVLASSSPSSGLGFKAFAVVVVAGGAFAVWKRKKASGGVEASSALRIVRRAPVGVRSELLVVDVEGKRLFLGVTPNAITTLSVLADDSEALADMETAEEPELTPRRVRETKDEAPAMARNDVRQADVPMQTDLLARLSSVMKTADLSTARTRASVSSAKETATEQDAPAASQRPTEARSKATEGTNRPRARSDKAVASPNVEPLEGQAQGLAALWNAR